MAGQNTAKNDCLSANLEHFLETIQSYSMQYISLQRFVEHQC